MAKAKPIVKAASLDKKITASTDSLTKACGDAVIAVTAKTAENNKFTTEIKRHTKKKAILTKRRKATAAKLKKIANAENKKSVAAVTKEMKSVQSALDKARASKSAVSTELATLKAASKRLTAYTKAIAAIDKVLNKPVKKKRAKKKV